MRDEINRQQVSAHRIGTTLSRSEGASYHGTLPWKPRSEKDKGKYKREKQACMPVGLRTRLSVYIQTILG